MKNFYIFFLFAFFSHKAFMQIDANSVMGIPSATDDTEINGITGANEGSMVYNIAQKNIYIFDGTNWVPVNKEKNTVGDIKYSSQSSDHNGWYLLNGRATSTLSSNVQSNASGLGFTTNLPNAQDRVLKHPSAGESIGDTGGQAATTLTRANLPNVNFTGTTSSNGNHSHTINRGIGTDQVRHNSDASRTFFNQGGTTNTSTTGNHNHTVTVSTGGSSQAFERYQPYLVFNTFIYLGL
ncbi:Microcystin-dependent protein [Tenacibaculum sp. MAR_2009_124]|uniref:hypothetical protein n=1 Tax=Tenacibaculum sp. MAR_2009_124 TaxID=1250059 RepID=UPI00089BF7E4|nr:hypothetical protein [Tenacibaculum sp. MAR_2009_124]SEB37119.1 Microcystin-dependent protein [Tenacibaculum sp. MAR_2009_124]